MLIQVNFTEAIWISANPDPDNIELTLKNYEYFIPSKHAER